MTTRDVIVYGNITEPTTGKSCIIVRLPKGLGWRKAKRAIRKLIDPWFSDSEKFWEVSEDLEDGETLWEEPARFEWNGTEFALTGVVKITEITRSCDALMKEGVPAVVDGEELMLVAISPQVAVDLIKLLVQKLADNKSFSSSLDLILVRSK